jgi:cytochrome c biogenesis protein ResB
MYMARLSLIWVQDNFQKGLPFCVHIRKKWGGRGKSTKYYKTHYITMNVIKTYAQDIQINANTTETQTDNTTNKLHEPFSHIVEKEQRKLENSFKKCK